MRKHWSSIMLLFVGGVLISLFMAITTNAQTKPKPDGTLTLYGDSNPTAATLVTGQYAPLLKITPAARVDISDTAPDSTVVCYKDQCRRLAELFPQMSFTTIGSNAFPIK